MKKYAIGMVLCLLLSSAIFPAGAEEGSWTLKSVTWQDPENAVVLWEETEGCTYEVYRSLTQDGVYERIGTATSGSYRDDQARYPETYFYKVLRVGADGTKGPLSAPMETGTNPQSVQSVPVIMYHNFVSEQDQKNGVEFEEYSITPADFESDLQWLRSNGYTAITSDDLLEYLYGNQPLPAKPIILSIDDGTKGVYDHAWPLLTKYKMKADFNIIGEQIDAAWETVNAGGSRDGEAAPYCTWNEILRMAESGTVNICSHTYGMHRFNNDGHSGLLMKDGETLEAYTQAVKDDFAQVTSSLTGWTGIVPRTVAYPYSKRSAETDQVLLENTTYEILMAGGDARSTNSNYFVEGASRESALTLMNRIVRMSDPVARCLAAAYESDYANGVNAAAQPCGPERCAELAAWYSPYDDVASDAWYAGSVYYVYANGLMTGTGSSTFSPSADITRAMVATMLYRMAGSPESGETAGFSDVPAGEWYAQAAAWAAQNNILPGLEDGTYQPEGGITREALAVCMYRCAAYLGQDCSASAALDGFADAESISPQAVEAMEWAVACGIYQGSGSAIMPDGNVTRAQMAKLLENWNSYAA